MGALAVLARRLALAVAIVAALAGPGAATLWFDTPDVSDIQERLESITAARGIPLLSEGQVPTMLAEAVVATEDERFYEHHGIDSIGLGRAVLYDVVNVCACQGGSTITEQLVKDVYLGGSDLGRNKIRDMTLALKAEEILTKSRIMADYLSEITTGFGIYGVTKAACAYFGAPLQTLTLGQYALLAGVTQSPSNYDPTINPGLAQERRSEVLAQMVANRFVTAAAAQAANAEPVLARGPDRPGC